MTVAAEPHPPTVDRTRAGHAATTSPPAIRHAPTDVVAPGASNPSTQAIAETLPDLHSPGSNDPPGQRCRVDHTTSAGDAPSTPIMERATPVRVASGWAELRLYAEIFDDLQRARIRFENQIRSATVDEDFAAGHLERLEKSEREAAKILKRALKRAAPHLYEWAQETRGVGEHTLARLLGSTGDPRRATPHHWQGEGADRILVADEPYDRNVAKLWAYCGCGDPERKRRKGMTAADGAALGNPRAKVAIHLMAEAQVKSRGFYRDVYDQARVEYATREGWTLGHQHAAALRRVKKELLKSIWRAA